MHKNTSKSAMKQQMDFGQKNRTISMPRQPTGMCKPELEYM